MVPKLPAVGSTMAWGIFGPGFGFRVGECAAGGVFQGVSASIGKAFILAGGAGCWLSFHGV